MTPSGCEFAETQLNLTSLTVRVLKFPPRLPELHLRPRLSRRQSRASRRLSAQLHQLSRAPLLVDPRLVLLLPQALRLPLPPLSPPVAPSVTAASTRLLPLAHLSSALLPVWPCSSKLPAAWPGLADGHSPKDINQGSFIPHFQFGSRCSQWCSNSIRRIVC